MRKTDPEQLIEGLSRLIRGHGPTYQGAYEDLPREALRRGMNVLTRNLRVILKDVKHRRSERKRCGTFVGDFGMTFPGRAQRLVVGS